MTAQFNREPPIACYTYAKGDESLVVLCVGLTDILLIHQGKTPECRRFDDPTALVVFQSDLEGELLQTGWTLLAFESHRPRSHRVPVSAASPTDMSM
jgi:hypothetical protein